MRVDTPLSRALAASRRPERVSDGLAALLHHFRASAADADAIEIAPAPAVRRPTLPDVSDAPPAESVWPATFLA